MKLLNQNLRRSGEIGVRTGGARIEDTVYGRRKTLKLFPQKGGDRVKGELFLWPSDHSQVIVRQR